MTGPSSAARGHFRLRLDCRSRGRRAGRRRRRAGRPRQEQPVSSPVIGAGSPDLPRPRPGPCGRCRSPCVIFSPSSVLCLLVVAAEAARRFLVADVVRIRAPGDFHRREHVPGVDVAERLACRRHGIILLRRDVGIVLGVETPRCPWQCRHAPLRATGNRPARPASPSFLMKGSVLSIVPESSATSISFCGWR